MHAKTQKPQPSEQQIELMKKYAEYFKSTNISCNDEEILTYMDDMERLWKDYDFYDHKFNENGCVGIKDVKGDIRIPAIYADILDLYEFGSGIYDNPIPVLNDEKKAGLVDCSGNVVTGFNYDDIRLVSPNYFVLRSGNKFGMADCDGNEVLACKYDSICEPCGKVFVTRRGDKYGFYAEEGKGLVIPCIYDEIDENADNVFVCLDGRWGYVSHKGNFIAEDNLNGQSVLSFGTCIY